MPAPRDFRIGKTGNPRARTYVNHNGHVVIQVGDTETTLNPESARLFGEAVIENARAILEKH